MTFGPNNEELVGYSHEEYDEALKLVQLQIDGDYKSDAIDHIKSILVGKVPDHILVEHPYETLQIVWDVALVKTNYLLSLFRNLTGDPTVDEDYCLEIVKLNGLAEVESRRLHSVVERVEKLNSDNESVVRKARFVMQTGPSTYAMITGFVSDIIANYRRKDNKR